MNTWEISVVVLWILQVVTALAVIGLARQVGLLHLRVHPVGPGTVETGPPIGSQVELSPVATFRSEVRSVLDANRLSLVLFVSHRCSLCSPVLDGLRRLSEVDPSVAFTVAADEDGRASIDYLVEHGIHDGVAAARLEMLDSGSRPFAIALNPEGYVLSSGVVNTLEQLEELLELAAQHSARIVPGDQRLGDAVETPETGTPHDHRREIELLGSASPRGMG